MLRFIKSASNSQSWYNHDRVEICFIGRSNVGKSSLINSLSKSMVSKVSNTPGRTQLINFFEDDQKNVYVDLPGYGFAQMPKNKLEKMHQMIDEYLQNRKNLKTIVLLFDSRRGILDQDLDFINWAKQAKKKIILLATKIDKLNQSQRHKLLVSLKELNLESSVLLVSSLKRTNIDHLKKLLASEFK